MISLIFLLNTLILLLCFVLLHQAHKASSSLLNLVSRAPDADPYLIRLDYLISLFIDDTLLLEIPYSRLEKMDIRIREHQDEYRNVYELIDYLFRSSRCKNQQDVHTLIKATYQLADTFELPLSLWENVFNELVHKLVCVSPTNIRVERVSAGQILDRKRMLPINFGTIVVFPLGMIVYTDEGNIVHMAKVFCK